MKIELLIIDPQIGFCWPGIDLTNMDAVQTMALQDNIPENILKPGSLYVPGADQDMIRLTAMIRRLKDKIDDIHVTLDSHHLIDIAHPIFWVDSHGNHPTPFTIIEKADVWNGKWTTTNPQWMPRAKDYVKALKDNGRYPLCIWPPHTLIGDWEYGVFPELFKALLEWESDFAMVDYVTKGSNFWTEHYSAVQADVPDPEDPDTQLDLKENSLIKTLERADMILMAGEARSHCLANTVMDIANTFGDENIKKMILLEDATSDVPDPPGTTMFTDMGKGFVKDMVARGMQRSTTVDILR